MTPEQERETDIDRSLEAPPTSPSPVPTPEMERADAERGREVEYAEEQEIVAMHEDAIRADAASRGMTVEFAPGDDDAVVPEAPLTRADMDNKALGDALWASRAAAIRYYNTLTARLTEEYAPARWEELSRLRASVERCEIREAYVLSREKPDEWYGFVQMAKALEAARVQMLETHEAERRWYGNYGTADAAWKSGRHIDAEKAEQDREDAQAAQPRMETEGD